jgi:purine-binding chemotaxis protein CheW
MTVAAGQTSVDEVFRRRARQLADRKTTVARVDTVGMLVFAIGAERYAIELSDLAEVVPFAGCTAVPGSPAAVLGVMNVRGEIGPVIDLRRVLGLEAGESGSSGYVLMLRQENRTIGFKVDAVEQVRQVAVTDLVSSEGRAAAFPGSRCVKALTADTVIVIDTRAALSLVSAARS